MTDNTGAVNELSRGTLASDELPLVVTVTEIMPTEALSDEPLAQPERTIHERRELPVPPPGAPVADPSPSPALEVSPPLAFAEAADSAPSDLTLVRNVPLATGTSASDVGEPSVASRNNTVFFTGNWYAAVSQDGGQSFSFINPAVAFPNPPGSQFCCDQVVHYIPQIDAFVWLLQYTDDGNNENRQRLAFARTADVVSSGWKIVDITSRNLGLPNVWLDFPDIAVGSNMLYVTSNGFDTADDWVASVVVRLPLAGIAALLKGTGAPTAQFSISRDNPSFRVAQHCLTRAFWATHQSTSAIRLFTWPESAAQPTFQDVQVASWNPSNYRSLTPSGKNWLERCDSRMVGATRRPGDELWFARAASRGGANNRPNPYVQIARLRVNGNTATLLENINVWDANLATSYAALGTNSRGEVGASYFVGGPTKHPSHVVGILTNPMKVAETEEGGNTSTQWGDYLTVRRHYGNTQRLFAATGYTLAPGATRGTPRFVLFGRAGDAA
jgi:hypothetical protein